MPELVQGWALSHQQECVSNVPAWLISKPSGNYGPERGGRGSVLAAWSIDNPLLTWRFRSKQQEFRGNVLQEADELQGFHGTSARNILSIATNGFDAGRRSGQVYGKGEYFAKCPDVSIGYCRGDGYMLVCRLALGKQASSQTLGDGDHIWVPSTRYYVIAAPEQVVPLYIIRFTLKSGSKELEDVLRLPEWSTIERGIVETIPANRPCAMKASSTDALWMGYLHPQHSDEQLESDIENFLRDSLPQEHWGHWQFAIVRGKYTQAKVRLEALVSREIVESLN